LREPSGQRHAQRCAAVDWCRAVSPTGRIAIFPTPHEQRITGCHL